jgi:8-oxo-dGTP pyrophosphatase MutT (NUDIX family)
MILVPKEKSAVISVWFGDKIMLTQRKGENFKGKYAVVGGKVEKDERIIKAAQRELLEETGLYFIDTQIHLLDCYDHERWKCFLFETFSEDYLFSHVKNKEPKKHTPWKLYSIEEALKLDLMPAIRDYLLTKAQVPFRLWER